MDKIKHFQMSMPDTMEAAIFCDPVHRFYLTGMRSSAGTVLVTKKKSWLIIDFRYIEDAEKKVTNCKVIEETSKYAQLRKILMEEEIHTLHVHNGVISVKEYQLMQKELSSVEIDISDQLRLLMENLRMKKDEEEIICHKKAQQITDHVFSHICNFIRPGMTELEISQEIGVMLTRLGSDDRNFNFIVASGENSSLPHGFATNRIVQNGDFVTMDFGAVYGGYLADMTRTIAVGHVSLEQKKVYETVLEAQKRALDKICPGAVCREIDAVARNYIYEKGYKGTFSHGLGHSVGVEVHENPRFNEQCEDKLIPGIVITVEPGIYLKGRFGVRIEDMIVVRENGIENLAMSTKNLIIL